MTNKLSSAGKHAVVVGAGFAGLRAASQLDPQVRVNLIDPADHFTGRVRLHETAAGRPDVTHPLRTFLQSTNVPHLRAQVILIDIGSAKVHTEAGHILDHHRLVYVLGGRTGGNEVTGASPERAYTAESPVQLHKRLLDSSRALTVVGGGLSGIELARPSARTARHPRVARLISGAN
ncbi:FAD-dependent oxidoreductase [Streptomyces aureus]|uniref:FAD-dependent oxidoreductase n=1 Tax=Streptomyces aureus TaxID=193461 RepID=A0ABV4SWI8_9ACTN